MGQWWILFLEPSCKCCQKGSFLPPFEASEIRNDTSQGQELLGTVVRMSHHPLHQLIVWTEEEALKAAVNTALVS